MSESTSLLYHTLKKTHTVKKTQQLLSLRAELEGMTNKVDAAERLRAVAQIACVPPSLVCPYPPLITQANTAAAFPQLPSLLTCLGACPSFQLLFCLQTPLYVQPQLARPAGIIHCCQNMYKVNNTRKQVESDNKLEA